MKFIYPMFFIGAMFGIGIVASQHDAVDYDLVCLSLRGGDGTKLYHEPYDEAINIDSPRSLSSSLLKRSEQSLCSLSYDDEEREQLLSSDEEVSLYSDDFESESGDDSDEADYLLASRYDADKVEKLMRCVGETLALNEYACDRASHLIEQMRKDIRQEKEARQLRYQAEIDDDQDDL